LNFLFVPPAALHARTLSFCGGSPEKDFRFFRRFFEFSLRQFIGMRKIVPGPGVRTSYGTTGSAIELGKNCFQLCGACSQSGDEQASTI
jgi:hypothetical protein